ncbi:conserved hypothetical protein [Trichormus variabilis ATCC 29413]|uniref:Uncharacterized protein n=2 Tax=Anabaena variabilis TaxID=264691 RepID=Q3MBG3_TRIV2|nr:MULTISPECIES: hypothetical protein [Nostocaceae]ABA21673.1 conserved hypothetical protein [Trichormus variabilis ATCC 29413]MBC1217056.1 hypothetical protein [Trichormus variabilis ARAD]MBC1256554.1 hypothetical protein [Trichormus variabilis V5]MBC1270306.1 hypothetical protein [Trichormus variabilis FSR]MBC1302251.1 hypothetical protein [Trichormus variabilis N2B]
MSEEIKPNLIEAPTHDAQLAAENIASGEEKAPKVDFDADYAAAQQFSISDVDRTAEGAAAAEAATAPQQEISVPEETRTEAQSTSNPDDYIELAKEIGASREDAVTSVSDDLVKQALEKGQAKK